eukprot:CAMPEP_0170615756 /NCGR_PEP_ID=MMETSP0224-20130122/25510_1 /TAXON_ID=285029 /ORGANISM="Togula jolla, Strain CCCM 725" /LENGTH=421 /DNA_ID=CAMNT_0010941515 /DNA_START=48 /DNA_END=1313 /DNA_ORIENTATION=-
MTEVQSARSGKRLEDMTAEEMEQALQQRFSKKFNRSSANNAPQTARTLLEENQYLIEEKKARKAIDRKNSHEFNESLLAKDRLTTENDKVREINRRRKQNELAMYYKAKISEKEAQKASEYHKKVESGVELQYFPFVEGEHITKNREAQSMKMREEMRGFLRRQREERPPRAMDSLQADTQRDPHQLYPIMGSSCPSHSGRRAAASCEPTRAENLSDNVAPHMARYPRFLSRATNHMSRRLTDGHVRKALEDKVKLTKAELEARLQKDQAEAAQVEDGMLVNDALRYDSLLSKAAERRRNAAFLENQIEERRRRDIMEVEEKRKEPAGYWGPEEKALQDSEQHRALCSDLVAQIEVNQHRRLDSRSRRLRQERRLVDNTMAEMSQDRVREQQKVVEQRQALKSTWQTQREIKEAKIAIQEY